jgi:NTP pyrophosphatase (non-canonical NTP hydrolase)
MEHDYKELSYLSDISVTGIASLQKLCYAIAAEHGFHDNETPGTVPVAEKLCLIHSELSEALEAHRDPKAMAMGLLHFAPNGKPEGVAAELADVVIRVLDLAESLNIDLHHAITAKCYYNETRPHKHGKSY